MTRQAASNEAIRKGRRRGFGTIERLPSGRCRVRWRDADGQRVTAEQTFATVADARRYLATVEADMLRRTYRAPKRVNESLSTYGWRWIETRPSLKHSTRHQYAIDFRRHVEPYLGDRLLDRIDPDVVRRWYVTLGADLRAELERTGRDGTATAARAYRLLRSILQTAVDDELLVRNPCRLVGAGDPRSPERPVLSIAEIAALAGAVPASYRAFVVLAAFSGLRAGELAALRLMDLDLRRGAAQVRVARRFYRVGGKMTVDIPKSHRGARTVVLPAFVATELRRHLKEHRPEAGPEELVFVTTGGRDVLDGYSQVIRHALHRIGRPDARAHDLRHTAMTAAAEHGATLATLMHMAGHSTSAAAQRYQHATVEYARRVAAALDASAGSALTRQRRKGGMEAAMPKRGTAPEGGPSGQRT
jgi:integrase